MTLNHIHSYFIVDCEHISLLYGLQPLRAETKSDLSLIPLTSKIVGKIVNENKWNSICEVPMYNANYCESDSSYWWLYTHTHQKKKLFFPWSCLTTNRVHLTRTIGVPPSYLPPSLSSPTIPLLFLPLCSHCKVLANSLPIQSRHSCKIQPTHVYLAHGLSLWLHMCICIIS